MSLVLDKKEIYTILSKRKFIKTKKQLLNMLRITSKNFFYFTDNCEMLNHDKNLNPFMWQVCHVIYFFDNLIFKNLNGCERLNNFKLDQNYDSFLTPLEYRDYKRISYKECVNYYKKLVNILENYIINNEITNIEAYLISLGILHNEMHNEAFIFCKLKLTNSFNFKINLDNNVDIIDNLEFIKYDGGRFRQGTDDQIDYLTFDNEMPSFIKSVKPFSISKYPITEYQFLQFVKENGYTNEKYWCDVSYKWKNKNNKSLPLYWYKTGDTYYKKINNKNIPVNTNLPMSNISYYEAKAYCKWKNVRLPTESEWEYVATNKGISKFPWGDDLPDNVKCNINYKNFIQPVNSYNYGNNKKNVSQLIGNIWEWCEEPIYPYNGFVIDPVYREMSYPFFGFKKICKGGCFAVQDFLIHPRYRNAQTPDCRIQFIGFRVCN